MNKEEALTLYEWAKKLEGTIVQYPSGLKKLKRLTDHTLKEVRQPSIFSEKNGKENWSCGITIINNKSGNEQSMSVDKLRKHNP